MSYLIEKISNAIAIAIKRDFGGSENTIVEIDPAKNRFYVAVRKNVVEEVEDPETEITLADATKYSKVAHIGGVVEIPLETKQFGRIAAQSAKHVIRQAISEAEKGQIAQKYMDKKYEIISVPILKIDEVKGNATVEIDKTEAILPKSEQVPGEELHEGQRVMVYVVDVLTGGKNPKLMISRSHPGLIKRLFEMHTPEIKDGTVEIKAVSREAGSRTKIAVWSKDENVDAVGACIGPKGSRVSAIVEELGGEKIDVIRYSEQPEELIAAALSPAEVSKVLVDQLEQKYAKQSFQTASSPLQSETRVRTFVWQQDSPAGRSISVQKARQSRSSKRWKPCAEKHRNRLTKLWKICLQTRNFKENTAVDKR